MRLLAGAEGHMVVTHLLEESMANQTVDTRDEDSLALFDLDLLDRVLSRRQSSRPCVRNCVRALSCTVYVRS